MHRRTNTVNILSRLSHFVNTAGIFAGIFDIIYAENIDFGIDLCYNDLNKILCGGCNTMKHIKTINTRNLCESAKNGGCGECQTSCQSACKTSCGIANQKCENKATEESK